MTETTNPQHDLTPEDVLPTDADPEPPGLPESALPEEGAPSAPDGKCRVCQRYIGENHGQPRDENCAVCYTALWRDARRVVTRVSKGSRLEIFTGDRSTDLEKFSHEAESVGRPCLTSRNACPASAYRSTQPGALICTRCRTKASIRLCPDLAFRLLESALQTHSKAAAAAIPTSPVAKRSRTATASLQPAAVTPPAQRERYEHTALPTPAPTPTRPPAPAPAAAAVPGPSLQPSPLPAAARPLPYYAGYPYAPYMMPGLGMGMGMGPLYGLPPGFPAPASALAQGYPGAQPLPAHALPPGMMQLPHGAATMSLPAGSVPQGMPMHAGMGYPGLAMDPAMMWSLAGAGMAGPGAGAGAGIGVGLGGTGGLPPHAEPIHAPARSVA